MNLQGQVVPQLVANCCQLASSAELVGGLEKTFGDYIVWGNEQCSQEVQDLGRDQSNKSCSFIVPENPNSVTVQVSLQTQLPALMLPGSFLVDIAAAKMKGIQRSHQLSNQKAPAVTAWWTKPWSQKSLGHLSHSGSSVMELTWMYKLGENIVYET